MEYKLYSSLYEDIGTGAIWVSGAEYPPRTIIKILCTNTKKSVYAEALLIEPNFLKKYNNPPRINIAGAENALVMNNWYRHLLGDIQSKNTYDFDITIPTGPRAYWGRLRATMKHPQLAIRVGTLLGILALFISILIPIFEKEAIMLEAMKGLGEEIFSITLNSDRAINLISAMFGMLGTILLFKGSFALESPSVYMNQNMVDQMSARNKRRALLQRLGLASLLISFSLQAAVQLF